LLALDDEDHINRTRRLVREEKAYLDRELKRINLPCNIGEGNYIMVQVPFSDTLAYRKLMAQGIMIRSMTGFRFPQYIRVTIARHEAMKDFIEGLERILT
jgi:histidinol-phosphate aminotransferase